MRLIEKSFTESLYTSLKESDNNWKVVKECTDGEIVEKDGKQYYNSGQTFNGHCFKDAEAYEKDRNAVCYITEDTMDELADDDDLVSVEEVNKNLSKYTEEGGISTHQSICDEVRAMLEQEEYFYEYDDGRRIEAKDIDDEFVEQVALDVFETVDWQTTDGYLMERDWLDALEDYYKNKPMSESVKLSEADAPEYLINVVSDDDGNEYLRYTKNPRYESPEDKKTRIAKRKKEIEKEKADKQKKLDARAKKGMTNYSITDKKSDVISSFANNVDPDVEVKNTHNYNGTLKFTKGDKSIGIDLRNKDVADDSFGCILDNTSSKYGDVVEDLKKLAYKRVNYSGGFGNKKYKLYLYKIEDIPKLAKVISDALSSEEITESVEDDIWKNIQDVKYEPDAEKKTYSVDDFNTLEDAIKEVKRVKGIDYFTRDEWESIDPDDMNACVDYIKDIVDNVLNESVEEKAKGLTLDVLEDMVYKTEAQVVVEDICKKAKSDELIDLILSKNFNNSDEIIDFIVGSEEVEKLREEELKESEEEHNVKYYVCLECDREFEIEDNKWPYGEGNCPYCLCGDIVLSDEDEEITESAKPNKNIFYFVVGICLDENRPNAYEDDFFDMPDFKIPFKLMEENFGVTKTIDEAVGYVENYVSDGVPGTFGVVVKSEEPFEGFKDDIYNGNNDSLEFGDIVNFKDNGGELVYCAYSTKDGVKTVEDVVYQYIDVGYTLPVKVVADINRLCDFVSDKENRKLFNSDGIDEEVVDLIKKIQKNMLKYKSKEELLSDVDFAIKFVNDNKEYFYDGINEEIIDDLEKIKKDANELKESYQHTAVIYYGTTEHDGDDVGEICCVVDNDKDFPDITEEDLDKAFKSDNLDIYNNDISGKEYMSDIELFDDKGWLEFKGKDDKGNFHFVITESLENNALRYNNIPLRGSGIKKHIEAVYTPGCLQVFNEEWGFCVYNGEVDTNSMENMSQYWFYDDYMNNEEFRNRIDKAAKALYNKMSKEYKEQSDLTESAKPKDKKLKYYITDYIDKDEADKCKNLYVYDLRDTGGEHYNIEKDVLINNIGVLVSNFDVLNGKDMITDKKFDSYARSIGAIPVYDFDEVASENSADAKEYTVEFEDKENSGTGKYYRYVVADSEEEAIDKAIKGSGMSKDKILSVSLTESAKSKKKKEDKRVIMQQGNVTCFKESDSKFLVFENENDNEKEYKDQESAMRDFMNRVGVDIDNELQEK